MSYLASIHVVSLALNLPGPLACAQLASWGATITKVEPPTGDPMQQYSAEWYAHLHAGIEVITLDLKSNDDQTRLAALLSNADLLVTSFRMSALARLGITKESIVEKYPNIVWLAVVGHASEGAEVKIPGHDLTYAAQANLLNPPHLPQSLFIDMTGAERISSTALALLVGRQLGTCDTRFAEVALANVATQFADAQKYGLTGNTQSVLGGGNPLYGVYPCADGWLALAALEPHFAERLQNKLDSTDRTNLQLKFLRQNAQYWQDFATENDLPIFAWPDDRAMTHTEFF